MSICSLPSLAPSIPPLTQENLRRLTALDARYFDGFDRTELVRRYCSSLNDLYSSKQRRYEDTAAYIIRGPAHWERQIRRCATTHNVAIDAQPLPFPYHNDAIFLPTNNIDMEISARPRSPARTKRSQSTLSSRRLTSSVWWQDMTRSRSCSSHIPRGGSATPLYLHTIDEDTVVSDVSSIKNWEGLPDGSPEYNDPYPVMVSPSQQNWSPPPPPPSTVAFQDTSSCFASLCRILKRPWRRRNFMRRG